MNQADSVVAQHLASRVGKLEWDKAVLMAQRDEALALVRELQEQVEALIPEPELDDTPPPDQPCIHCGFLVPFGEHRCPQCDEIHVPGPGEGVEPTIENDESLDGD